MSRRKWRISLIAILALIFLLNLLYPGILHPGLAIHVRNSTWKSVTLKYEDPRKSQITFSPNDLPLFGTLPIEYGVYKIRVDYGGGEVVWATYYHTDARVRRRVDIYVEPLGAGKVRFKTVSNSFNVISTKTALAIETSEEMPLVLDWI